MKQALLICAAVALGAAAIAEQISTVTIRQVRDPVQLRKLLSDNASDAETRIAAVEAAGVGGTLPTAQIIVGDAESNATAVAVSGDVTISSAGAVAIASGVIVNADVKTDAAIAATKIAGTAVTYSSAAQSDTNATTDATAYNAAFVGQWLIGGAGPATNALWVARATGTNGWQQIKP